MRPLTAGDGRSKRISWKHLENRRRPPECPSSIATHDSPDMGDKLTRWMNGRSNQPAEDVIFSRAFGREKLSFRFLPMISISEQNGTSLIPIKRSPTQFATERYARCLNYGPIESRFIVSSKMSDGSAKGFVFCQIGRD